MKQHYTKGIPKNTNKKDHNRVHEFAAKVQEAQAPHSQPGNVVWKALSWKSIDRQNMHEKEFLERSLIGVRCFDESCF